MNWLVLSTWTCRGVWTRGVPWTRNMPDEQRRLPMPVWPRLWRGPVRVQWVVAVVEVCKNYKRYIDSQWIFCNFYCWSGVDINRECIKALWVFVDVLLYNYITCTCLYGLFLCIISDNEYLYYMHASTFLSEMECACNKHNIFCLLKVVLCFYVVKFQPCWKYWRVAINYTNN